MEKTLFGGYLLPFATKIGMAPKKEIKRIQQSTAMKGLLGCHEKLENKDLLTRLEGIKSKGQLDIMVERGIPFFLLATNIFNRAPFTAAETSRLVTMLAWDELRKYPTRGATVRIVRAITHNPWAEHVPPLQDHFTWLKKQKLETKDLTYAQDLDREMGLLEELIPVFRQWEEPRHGDVT